jgi:hypothetical protein
LAADIRDGSARSAQDDALNIRHKRDDEAADTVGI